MEGHQHLIAARAEFESAGIPFPSVPEPLAARLARRTQLSWSTDEAVAAPERLDDHLEALRQPGCPDYAIVALSGHGSRSWAVRTHLVKRPIAVLTETAWGNAGDTDEDRKSATERMRLRYSQAEKVLETGDNVTDAGLDWLVVADSDFGTAGWGELREGEDPVWHSTREPWTEVLAKFGS